MAPILVGLYVVAAIICGLMGRRTTIGFIGHVILALVLTPLGDWLIQVVGRTTVPEPREDHGVEER